MIVLLLDLACSSPPFLKDLVHLGSAGRVAHVDRWDDFTWLNELYKSLKLQVTAVFRVWNTIDLDSIPVVLGSYFLQRADLAEGPASGFYRQDITIGWFQLPRMLQESLRIEFVHG